MNPEPIDERRISALFAKSEASEHKQPILRSTRPRWLRLTVGEAEQLQNRRKRVRNTLFSSALISLCLCSAAYFGSKMAAEWLYPAASTPMAPEPPRATPAPFLAPREGVWREGRLQSYTF